MRKQESAGNHIELAQSKSRWPRDLWLLACLLGVSLLLVLFAPLSYRIGCTGVDDCYQREHAARLLCVQIAGGLFAIFGLWLAVQRIDQTRADQTRKEKEERVARYIRSMGLLGSMRDRDTRGKEPNIESRLGAVRALHALWLEAPSEFQYILPTLNDYVREGLRRLPYMLEPNDADEKPPEAWRSEVNGGARPDIRVALEILISARHKLCLANTFLDQMDLRGEQLPEADFRWSRLQEIRLEGTVLSRANFQSADLASANLRDADLRGADFRGAYLARTTLEGADLAGATFWANERDEPEDYRGIDPETVIAGRNWSSAKFSPEFRARLDAVSEQAASSE